MSSLHTLPKIVDKKAKRRGRGLGSGAGAKSGRGTTRHQTARTKMPLWFEGGQNPITKKFPFVRGKTRNKSMQVKPIVVNVGALNAFKKDETIDIPSLIEKKICKKHALVKGVKILGRGSLKTAVKVTLPVSEKAREKIEKAGGTIVTS